MNLFGWRSVAYASTVLLPTAGAAILAALSDAWPTIGHDFYIASAQILPVLLLAHVVRVGSVRTRIMSKHERLSDLRKESDALLGKQIELVAKRDELHTETDELLTKRVELLTEGIDLLEGRDDQSAKRDELLAERDEVLAGQQAEAASKAEQKQEEEQALADSKGKVALVGGLVDRDERSVEDMIQFLAGNLFATLLVGFVGLGAILQVLAHGSDSPVTFSLTVSGLGLTATGLFWLEAVLFTMPSRPVE